MWCPWDVGRRRRQWGFGKGLGWLDAWSVLLDVAMELVVAGGSPQVARPALGDSPAPVSEGTAFSLRLKRSAAA